MALEPRRVEELDLNQDLDFQRTHWTVQRVGWTLMVAISVAAALGVFGGAGPLVQATVGGEAGSLRMRYDRIARRHAPTRLEVELPGGAAKDGRVGIVLDREYVRGLEVERIVPEPESETVTAAGIVYVFRVADPARPNTLTFHVEPDQAGWRRGRVWLDGSRPLPFQQFVYP